MGNSSFRFLNLLLCFCLSATAVFGSADSFRCTWRDNPSTTMVVAWNQLSGSAPVLYFDTVDHGTDVTQYAYRQSPDRVILAKGMNNQFTRLENLLPNTVYYFVVKDSEGVGRRYSFKTVPDHPSAPLSIIAGGDSRNHRTSRQNANRLVKKLRPHVVFFGGDMTGGDTGREWIEWFADWQLTIGDDGRITPVVAARGNHEASNTSILNLFDVPNDGVYYALTFGGDLLRVYTLNSLIATGGAQREWLDNDLGQHQHIRWKMAQYHFPIRPHTRSKKDRNNQMQNWATLFHEHQVKLVVECDGHVVKTTYPVRPSLEAGSHQGFIRDDEEGTVYIGEGCWGAPLRRNNDDKSWTRSSGSFNQFKWVFVFPDRIEARTVKTDNAEQVSPIDPADVFQIPNGLNVWNPSTGDVITIPLSGGREELARLNSPMEIINFETETLGGDVYIQWTARNEKPQMSYEIQRSLDGQSYTTIASIVPTTQLLRENIYKLTDRNQKAYEQLSYRLKQVDGRGEIIYMAPSRKTVAQAVSWHEASRILPDPQTGLLKVKYKLEKAGDVTIRMLNLKHQEVSNSQYHNQRSGNYLKSIDMKAMPRGRYLLMIQIGGAIISRFEVVNGA